MTDLVEQVARALLAVEDSWNDHEWEQVPIGTQRLFLMQARAVIPVVREDCAKVAESFDGCNDPVDAIAAALREGRG